MLWRKEFFCLSGILLVKCIGVQNAGIEKCAFVSENTKKLRELNVGLVEWCLPQSFSFPYLSSSLSATIMSCTNRMAANSTSSPMALRASVRVEGEGF